MVSPSPLKGCISEPELKQIFIAKCKDTQVDFDDRHYSRFVDQHSKTAGLKSFQMQHSSIGAHAAVVIAGLVKHKPGIRVVDLTDNQIGTKGALRFARLIYGTNRLISVSLGSNSIADEGVEALFHALCTNISVVAVDLGSAAPVGRNSFGLRASRTLSKMLRHNLALSSLNISMCELTADLITIVADGLSQNGTLSELELSCNSIRSKGAAALLSACIKSRIVRLGLASNEIGDEVAPIVTQYLTKNQYVKSLDLSANMFTKRFAIAIAPGLAGGVSLESLNLSRNALRGEGISAIGKSLRTNASLRALFVDGCHIEADGFREFCDSLRFNSTLATLHVARNSILDIGAQGLAEIIPKGVLRDLDVAKCDITDSGGTALFHAFGKSTAICRISIRHNHIQNGPLLHRVMLASPQILKLDAEYNTLDYRFIFEVQRLVAGNRRARKLAKAKFTPSLSHQVAGLGDRLRGARTALLAMKEEVISLSEQVDARQKEIVDSAVSRDARIERLQQRLSEADEASSKLTDHCRDEMGRFRQVVEERMAEVTALTQTSENRVSQVIRESRALSAAEGQVRELERIQTFSSEEWQRKLSDAKMKYREAKEILVMMWKEAVAEAKKVRRVAESAGGRRKKRAESAELAQERPQTADAVERKQKELPEDSESEKAPKTKGKRPTSVLRNSPKIVRPATKQKEVKMDTPKLARQQMPADT
jgi:Ran GTPase-activating protein (RanGAP) involved in mRNA processing and transport